MSHTATKNEPTDKKEAAKAATPIVEALEEDDEFEEFASAAAWDEVKDGVPATDEAAQWQENWDDDDIDDDFTKALRMELMANSST